MFESTSLRRSSSGFLRRRASGNAAPITTMPRTRGGRSNAGARLLLGAEGEPAWTRPLLLALLLGVAALYLVDLRASGNANEFYAAAVKSGTESLRAWLFGSLDAANAITVDKPPASLWVMVLSARIFGYSSWSMLVPQALMGVGTVALLYATVKRWAGPAAGLIAGALVALTPVAALMFRFNNPDALLVLLMTAAAYAVVRAVDTPARAVQWLVLAGTALGFAFLTKMLQGLLVLPAFGLTYLVAAPIRLRARLAHLLAAAAALIVSAGWFVLLVQIWPASARPYIGGSTNNSLWELALGYNGLGRILSGQGSGGGTGGGGNAGFGGAAGLLRMFNTAFGTEISWLLPAALIALVAGLAWTRKAPRTDRGRAGLLLWGSWLAVSVTVFSFMSGTIHPYYTVALAPAIGALIGSVGVLLWDCRQDPTARGVLAVMIAATAIWGCYLMGRDAYHWMSWVRWTMLVGGVLGAAVLALSGGVLRRFAVVAVLVGSLAALGGTTSWTLATAAAAHRGSIPTSGPASASASSRAETGGMGGFRGPMAAQPGGSDSDTQSGDLVNLLNDTSTRWSAAVVGSQTASGYILSTDTAVMAIGGFSGGDNSPTLEQFQAYVAAGQVNYFLVGGNDRGGFGGGPGGGDSSSASAITQWVESNFKATTVGGVTVYDLTG